VYTRFISLNPYTYRTKKYKGVDVNIRRKSQKACLRLVIFSVLFLFLFSSNSNTDAFIEMTLPQVGLIPSGPIDDNSFNQMAYEGLIQAENENLIVGHLYQPTGDTEPEYIAAIAQCVAGGNSLCITVGWAMGNPTMAAAMSNPGINFAIVDVTWNEPDYPPNLRGLAFSVPEAAYLAGTLAGLMTATDKIGVVAGMSIPPVYEFVFPYIYGAQWANHSVYSLLEYANNFGDEWLGAAIAQSQIDRGADVILGVGATMGNGAIKQAGLQSKYFIGVDVDTYHTVFGGGTVTGAEYLLTSIVKRVNIAVYDTILAHVNDTFSSGTYVYDFENGGVGLAPYHETESIIPPNVISYLDGVAAGIADGSIDVWQPFFTDFIYLPSILR
jgi:basic membrane protein A